MALDVDRFGSATRKRRMSEERSSGCGLEALGLQPTDVPLGYTFPRGASMEVNHACTEWLRGRGLLVDNYFDFHSREAQAGIAKRNKRARAMALAADGWDFHAEDCGMESEEEAR